ncbi:hypothetical protein KNE206_75800 [Kitasatospora sp. NE20-6]
MQRQPHGIVAGTVEPSGERERERDGGRPGPGSRCGGPVGDRAAAAACRTGQETLTALQAAATALYSALPAP